MTKIRFALSILTVAVVGILLYLVALYARGYRLNSETYKFTPNGLLVIKSDPDSAQVFINGELKTATNATIPLNPGTYDIRVQKEGYFTWSKRLNIDKEIVTEATAHLFKTAPSLSAVTFSTSLNPIASRDMTKIAYVIPPVVNSNGGIDVEGLWVMELVNLPLGFAREPKRITDGDLTTSSWKWSPDNREILLTTKQGVYLLNSGIFTSQAQRVNVIAREKEILASWNKELLKRHEAQISKLPEEMKDVLTRKSGSYVFSPDEEMLVYIASSSANIPQNLINPLPGESTQKEERNIKVGHTYVYDIIEDRNFLVDENSENLVIESGYPSSSERRISWFPTSRHLILAEKDKITIMDYDGTNRQIVYAGSYSAPNAYPALSHDRLLILTNLGSTSSLPNLYSLSIK